MGVKITDSGVGAALAKYAGRAAEASAAAAYQKALQVIAAAAAIIPVETGRARASRYVTIPDPSRPRVQMGFGASYSLPLHENLDAHHEHGQAKFLELALQENSPVGDWIARKTIENIKGGVGIRPSGSMAATEEAGRAAGDGHAAKRSKKK